MHSEEYLPKEPQNTLVEVDEPQVRSWEPDVENVHDKLESRQRAGTVQSQSEPVLEGQGEGNTRLQFAESDFPLGGVTNVLFAIERRVQLLGLICMSSSLSTDL
jgi:hypothetical protein